MTMADANYSEPPLFDSLDRAGAKLAVEMLEELEHRGQRAAATRADLCGLEAKYRHGRPQRDIVGEYLERARAAGSEAESSFTRLLSDFVSQCRGGGGVPDTENYRGTYLARRNRS
jgi:hypothetical protein